MLRTPCPPSQAVLARVRAEIEAGEEHSDDEHPWVSSRRGRASPQSLLAEQSRAGAWAAAGWLGTRCMLSVERSPTAPCMQAGAQRLPHRV